MQSYIKQHFIFNKQQTIFLNPIRQNSNWNVEKKWLNNCLVHVKAILSQTVKATSSENVCLGWTLVKTKVNSKSRAKEQAGR